MKKHFLGIYEKAINSKFSWEERILMAKRAKFDFIELSIDESDERLARLEWSKSEIGQVLALLQKHNFYFNSICLSAHRRFPFGSKDPLIRAKALDIAHKACILAQKLGVRIIQVAAYDVYYEPADKETRRNFIIGIKKFVKLAQKYSIILAFETMDTAFAGTISRCLNLIRECGTSSLFLYPDLGNLWRFSNDIEGEIELGKTHSVAFHFKDTLPQMFKKVEFGSGDVDFVKALKAVLNTKFSGPFLIEMWSQNSPKENFQENYKKLLKAREFFETKFKLATLALAKNK